MFLFFIKLTSGFRLDEKARWGGGGFFLEIRTLFRATFGDGDAKPAAED